MCLETTICSIKMKNPLMLASGILGTTKESIEFFKKAGAVVTKSIGKEERKGHPNPTFVELSHGILNAMGLPNPGIEEYIKEIENIEIENIIGSIFGKSTREFIFVAKKMEEYVKAIELNMSCPHAEGYGEAFPTTEIKKVVEKVKEVVDVPVFVKLGVEDIKRRAQEAVKGGADGIVAINTIKAMAIDIETSLPILGNVYGGYSGPAIKPIGIRCVYELSSLNIPIIGVGGILTGKDVIEYMMAGASAVQIGSGIYYRGKEIFEEVCREMKLWLKEHGYQKIEQIVGKAGMV
ncbi:MAG: dihydroorotate dehydrogenase [Thermoplasmata archaeon]|nr:MAG: dihydroorotate dehydrogenase [Thermoplasmata archaeon]